MHVEVKFWSHQRLEGCPAANSIQLVIQNCTCMAATAAQHVCYLQRHTLDAEFVGTHAATVVSFARWKAVEPERLE